MNEKGRRKSSVSKSEKPRGKVPLEYPVRLNKYIAKCGSHSRRKAGELVKAGLISVNGKVVHEPYVEVVESDVVMYKGKKLVPERTLHYFLLNKPKNVISTTADEKNRITVIDLINFDGDERLYPIGRLDRDTTGLIVITNDGDLAARLSHPSFEVKKNYVVRLDRPITESDLRMIRDGVHLEDGLAKVDFVQIPNPTNKRKVELSLHIGRNRIVRRIFSKLGYEIKYLDRNYYAGLTSKGLPRGKYRRLRKQEIIMLRHFT